ncbi:RNA polymerase sigma factor sigM, partial [Dysosmobacter welbionis]
MRGLLLGLLGGLSFLPALCLGRSGSVPGTAGTALGPTVSLILGGVLLLGLRRLLGFARSGLRALCLSFLRSRFGGSRFVPACGLFQPKRSVQIALFKSSHEASYPAPRPAAIFPLLACVMMGRSRPRIIRSPLLLAAPEVVARLHCALLGHSGLDGGLYHLGPGVLDPAHVAEAAALAA